MIKMLFCTLVLCSGMAACQGASATREPDEKADTTPTGERTATPDETPGAEKTEALPSGLFGQIIAASDVSGQPDEPLVDQMVVAIPSEIAGELLGAGAASPTGEELRFLRKNLAQAHPAVTITHSDAAGNYTLLLDPGEYILCLADPDQSSGFPATTRGCGRVQVHPEKLSQVDISSGFGEMLLVEP